ncbi:potassium channel family protein [Modicisalibacter sp. 'Wilcox']|uniref:potassium channel family protein n=1 Tax=Modicisalibacter sp. 'Wilcox' TaxID=2679914 RepID=UPI000792AAE1|nr:potassium channel family protein [Modicisalibacter sp. 'Wilcox']KXS37031.1 MAG: hypothetical protein AWU55_2687 [Halomonadaceae bacterium T82-2]
MSQSLLFIVAGSALVLLAIYDAARTTLSASSSGPVTNRLISLIWRWLLWQHRRRRNHALLAAAGPCIAGALMLSWIVIAWTGWWLLFSSEPLAVVNATSRVAASLGERAYFTGYTLTTLGYGDFVPANALWRFLSVVAASNGLILFTLAVTYIVPVVSAVTHKRQLALTISAIGRTPCRIAAATAGDGDYRSLANQLQQVQGDIASLGQQHLAYPVLHYFHSRHADHALPVALARLYQALVVLQHACPALPATVRFQLATTQALIDGFLATLDSAFIHPASRSPRLPSLDDFATLPGITHDDEAWRRMHATLGNQRLLLAYIEKDGWAWHDVWGDGLARE